MVDRQPDAIVPDHQHAPTVHRFHGDDDAARGAGGKGVFQRIGDDFGNQHRQWQQAVDLDLGRRHIDMAADIAGAGSIGEFVADRLQMHRQWLFRRLCIIKPAVDAPHCLDAGHRVLKHRRR